MEINTEKLRLRSKGVTEPGENGFEAVVEEVVFFGDHVKLMLRLGGGQKLVAKSSVEAVAQFGVVGRELRVSWAPQDCAIFALPNYPIASLGGNG